MHPLLEMKLAKSLTEKSRELRDQAMDTIQTTVDKTEKLVSEGRNRVESTVADTRNRVQGRVSDMKDSSGSVVNNVRQQVSENLRDAADTVDPDTPA